MRLIPILILLFCSAQVSAQVYKWVDAQGNVHYMDQPVEGAEELKITGRKPPKPKPEPEAKEELSPEPPADSEEATETEYKSLRIIRPKTEQALQSAAGNVVVQLKLDQPLDMEYGHKVVIFLDGKRYGNPGTSLTTTLSNIERGAHRLRAAIVDAKGKRLIRSRVITFHLLRPSRLTP